MDGNAKDDNNAYNNHHPLTRPEEIIKRKSILRQNLNLQQDGEPAALREDAMVHATDGVVDTTTSQLAKVSEKLVPDATTTTTRKSRVRAARDSIMNFVVSPIMKKKSTVKPIIDADFPGKTDKIYYKVSTLAIVDPNSQAKMEEFAKHGKRGSDRGSSTSAPAWKHTRDTFIPRGIVHPASSFRSKWDIMISVLLVYTVVMAPVHACFGVVPTGFAATYEQVADFIFLIDILVSFNSAYLDKETLVVSRYKIALRYIKSWFFFDLIAILPFETLLNASSSFDRVNTITKLPKLLRVLKMLRLLKLLRVARLQILIHRLETVYGFHAGITRMGKMIFWVVVFNHVLACFWYLIPTFEGEAEPTSWIVRHGISEDDSLSQKYIASAYWVFSTLTTVGYGDIVAYTRGEKIYSLLVMAMGVTWYAFVVSSMSSIMGSFDTFNATMRDQLIKLNAFMRDANLPQPLRKRLVSHMQAASSDKSNLYEADDILAEVPATLRVEVLMFMYKDMISEIAYLKGKTPQFTVRLVVKLLPLFVQTGGHIIEEGTHADEMYFLTSGRAQARKHNRIVGEILPGSYFGEVGCILSDIRHASVIALTLCELYTVLKHDLFEIMNDFPEFSKELRKKAVARLQNDKREWVVKGKLLKKFGIKRRTSTANPSIKIDSIKAKKKIQDLEARLNANLESTLAKISAALEQVENAITAAA